jgi:hypothetical protein
MSASPIASAFKRAWRAALIAGAWVLTQTSGCSDIAARDAPKDYLDQSTAVTVTVVGRPLVFARERPNFAVHMRDYITLAAAAVNRSGKIEYILIAYFWTTFDPHAREGDAQVQRPDDLVILADDRKIQLVKADRSAHEVGIDEPVHAPAVGAGAPNIYRADPAMLRYIAAARALRTQARIGDTELNFEIWDDRRAALAEWVRHLAGE